MSMTAEMNRKLVSRAKEKAITVTICFVFDLF